jgi:hypothetical protein
MVVDATLVWQVIDRYQEAVLGDFEEGDGVRFSLEYYPTCYRRGRWRLLVEVAQGPAHKLWGCFDDQDMPLRWYHFEANAKAEAQEIARVLLADRTRP